MNRKNFFIILTVLALYSAAFSGCAETGEKENIPVQTAAVNNYVPKETDKTISGEVTKITGNRITLALGTVSSDNSQVPGQGSKMPEGEFTPPSGEMPQMNGEKPDRGGERPDMNGEMPAQGKGGRRGSSTVQKTGEEAEYILPVGMPIDGLSGRNTDYSGVTAGAVITLTVNEKGVVCAAEVS